MKITRRDVVELVLRLLSVALLLGAVAFAVFLIIEYASVVGLGDVSWGSFVSLLLFFSVVPALGAIAVWKAANHVRRGGHGSIQ